MFVTVFVLGMMYNIYTDIRELLLYDAVQLVLFLTAGARAIHLGIISEAIYGSLACGGVLLTIYYASRGGMGAGDVLLGIVLGAWLGVEQGLLCLLFAFVSAAVVGVLLVLGRVCSRKQALPFGPYLCVYALAFYFYGDVLSAYYWHLLWS